MDISILSSKISPDCEKKSHKMIASKIFAKISAIAIFATAIFCTCFQISTFKTQGYSDGSHSSGVGSRHLLDDNLPDIVSRSSYPVPGSESLQVLESSWQDLDRELSVLKWKLKSAQLALATVATASPAFVCPDLIFKRRPSEEIPEAPTFTEFYGLHGKKDTPFPEYHHYFNLGGIVSRKLSQEQNDGGAQPDMMGVHASMIEQAVQTELQGIAHRNTVSQLPSELQVSALTGPTGTITPVQERIASTRSQIDRINVMIGLTMGSTLGTVLIVPKIICSLEESGFLPKIPLPEFNNPNVEVSQFGSLGRRLRTLNRLDGNWKLDYNVVRFGQVMEGRLTLDLKAVSGQEVWAAFGVGPTNPEGSRMFDKDAVVVLRFADGTCGVVDGHTKAAPVRLGTVDTVDNDLFGTSCRIEGDQLIGIFKKYVLSTTTIEDKPINVNGEQQISYAFGRHVNGELNYHGPVNRGAENLERF